MLPCLTQPASGTGNSNQIDKRHQDDKSMKPLSSNNFSNTLSYVALRYLILFETSSPKDLEPTIKFDSAAPYWRLENHYHIITTELDSVLVT